MSLSSNAKKSLTSSYDDTSILIDIDPSDNESVIPVKISKKDDDTMSEEYDNRREKLDEVRQKKKFFNFTDDQLLYITNPNILKTLEKQNLSLK